MKISEKDAKGGGGFKSFKNNILVGYVGVGSNKEPEATEFIQILGQEG